MKNMLFVKIIFIILFLIPFTAKATVDPFVILESTDLAKDDVDLVFYDEAFNCGSVSAIGCYTYSKNEIPRIEIVNTLDDNDFTFVLLHEIGHHKTLSYAPQGEEEEYADDFAFFTLGKEEPIQLMMCGEENCFSYWTAKKKINSFEEFISWKKQLKKIYKPFSIKFYYYEKRKNRD